jgi:hypothetical protein
MERLKRVRTCVDDVRSRLSLAATRVDVKKQIDKHVRDNRRMNTNETVKLTYFLAIAVIHPPV